MEQFLFWLLLPIAALSGWVLAKRENRTAQGSSSANDPLSREYYKGINYILNEQPDKAIDLFLKLSEVDKDTAEVHLALGCLFRQRGEVDRAIRVHQSLINRTGLSSDLHHQALRSLALDYMSAGLLDRAESLCLELHDARPNDVSALNLLKDIYQQEKEWFRAIDVARKIESCEKQSQASVIAQYYCELAEQGLSKCDEAHARRMLDKAVQEDPCCGRAIILQGKMEYKAGNYHEAIRIFQSLEQKAPEYLSEVLPQLTDCYASLGWQDRLVDYLKRVISKNHSIELVLAAAAVLSSQKGSDDALCFLGAEILKKPSLRGIQYMLELDLAISEDQKGYLALVKKALDNLLKNKPVYKCSHCGFIGMDMHWCCPSCKSWSSIKPIQEFQWGASI